MKIVHIRGTLDTPYDGASVAAAKQIASQKSVAEVRAYNVRVTSAELILADLRADQPDLVVFHEIYRPPFLPIASFLKKQKIPYVVIPHGGLSKCAQSQKRAKKAVGNLLFFNCYLRGAAAVHYLSEGERAESVFRGPCFVLPNGADLAVAPRIKKTDPNRVRFLFIGRPDVCLKGLDLLLDAVKMKKDLLISHGARFSLRGPEMEATIGPLIRERGLETLVDTGEPVTGAEKEDCFAATDIYIQTSRSEGMPMVILEAAAHGLCCVVTEGTRMNDVISAYGAGIGCKTSAEAIADALGAVLKNAEAIDRMGQRARQMVEEKYDWAMIARSAIEKYAEIVDAAH